MIKLCQPPVDQSQLAGGMINEDVERFDVAVDDAFRVAEIESEEQLVDVVALLRCEIEVEVESEQESRHEGGESENISAERQASKRARERRLTTSPSVNLA